MTKRQYRFGQAYQLRQNERYAKHFKRRLKELLKRPPHLAAIKKTLENAGLY